MSKTPPSPNAQVQTPPSPNAQVPSKCPIPSADRDAAHGTLRGVVGETDAAVVDEARQRRPPLQAVVHGLCQRRLGGELAALPSHPSLEVVHQRLGPFTTKLRDAAPASQARGSI